MRHVILTCKNHPDLRWSCKSISCNEEAKPGEHARYNGSRSIFFNGTPTGKGMYSDGSGLDCSTVVWKDGDYRTGVAERFVHECSCPASDLIIAPEDALVNRPPPVVEAPLLEPVLPDDPTLLQELKDIISRGGNTRIEAIKHLRNRTGMGLFESHAVVQKMGGT